MEHPPLRQRPLLITREKQRRYKIERPLSVYNTRPQLDPADEFTEILWGTLLSHAYFIV